VSEQHGTLHDLLEGRLSDHASHRVQRIDHVARALPLPCLLWANVVVEFVVRCVVGACEFAQSCDRRELRICCASQDAAHPQAIQRAAQLRAQVRVRHERRLSRIGDQLCIAALVPQRQGEHAHQRRKRNFERGAAFEVAMHEMHQQTYAAMRRYVDRTFPVTKGKRPKSVSDRDIAAFDALVGSHARVIGDDVV
jgi:hypothetical protein